MDENAVQNANETVLPDEPTEPNVNEPSAAPSTSASPESEEATPTGYQFKDPEFQALVESVGEETLKSVTQHYTQIMQQQEAEEQARQQKEWEAAQAEHRNSRAELKEQTYQKIMRDRLAKAKPPNEEEASRLMRMAWADAEDLVAEQRAREIAAETMGRYLEGQRRATTEMSQLFQKNPDMLPYKGYITDLVENQGASADKVVQRIREVTDVQKNMGLATPMPSGQSNYPPHQTLAQMGATAGHRGLTAVPDEKAEDKEIDSIVANMMNL